MLISKRNISRREMTCMRAQGGYRENDIINNARWVTTSGQGRFVKFIKPNKSYRQSKFESTKNYSATFDRKRCTWVG